MNGLGNVGQAVAAGRPALVIIVSPASSGRFCARLAEGDELLVASSRQPFVDAARVLIEKGHDADAALVMKHAGTDTVALRSRIGTAAGLTVDERSRPLFTRWMPFPRAAVSPGIAPSDQSAKPPSGRRNAYQRAHLLPDRGRGRVTRGRTAASRADLNCR
jgi:hypothetical protein